MSLNIIVLGSDLPMAYMATLHLKSQEHLFNVTRQHHRRASDKKCVPPYE